MRVLQVLVNTTLGGAEKLVSDMIPLIKEKGHECDLLFLNGKNNGFKENTQKKGINIIDLSFGSIYNPILIYKLAKVMKKYDVVHVHLFPSFYYAALANLFISRAKRPKLIYTEHNTDNRRMNMKIFSIIDKYIYSLYDKIVCITDEIYDILVDYLNNFPKNKLVVIDNGVDLSQIYDYQCDKEAVINIKKELNLQEDDCLLLQVSAFREQKDQETVINALQYLPDNVKIVFLGEGKTQKKCKNLAKELNKEDKVHFLGIKQNVCDYFQIADYIILSSHYEGLSLSSIEGMASGKPFIASDVKGLSQISGAGILFKESDSRDLADKIMELERDRNYYNQVVSKCIERSKKYDIKNTVNRYIQEYEKVLD